MKATFWLLFLYLLIIHMYYFDFKKNIIIVIHKSGKGLFVMLFLRIQKPVFVFQSPNGKEFYIDPKTNAIADRETAFADYEGLKTTAKRKVYCENLKHNNSKQMVNVQSNTFETSDAAYLFNKLTLETKDYKNDDVFKFTRLSKDCNKNIKKDRGEENLITGFFSLWFKSLSKLPFLRKFDDLEDEETELEVDVDSGNMSDNKDKKRKKKWFVFA